MLIRLNQRDYCAIKFSRISLFVKGNSLIPSKFVFDAKYQRRWNRLGIQTRLKAMKESSYVHASPNGLSSVIFAEGSNVNRKWITCTLESMLGELVELI